MLSHILVIEDDVSILELIKLVLEVEGGYQVTLSESIFQDLVEVECIHPDMIILDLKLNKTEDGWVFLERLRTHHSLKNVPILLCTATIIGPALEGKEIAILHKPFGIDELLQCVCQCLSKRL